MTATRCECVSLHAPSVAVYVMHHIVPVEWGDEGGPALTLCPTADHNVHMLINLYVAHGRKPPGTYTKLFSTYIKGLAEQAWAQRPKAAPPSPIAACCHLQR